MKQVVQRRGTGTVEVIDVPPPARAAGRVLIRTSHSVISAGTERATVESGKRSIVRKALDRPELVGQVMRAALREGPIAAVQGTTARLSSWTPLGYSAAGTVLEADELGRFRERERVACGGAAFANHAEIISAPVHLCVRVPRGVSSSDAAFATVGAIAMQGARVLLPQIGEIVAVIGLGLIGQIAVQILRSAGCRVLAYDLDAERAELAARLGAERSCTTEEELAQRAADLSDGHGADAVLIAAATSSARPVELAGELCREKGRVVVVGDVRLQVPRGPYYAKELDLRLSRSYGPGRYDRGYEEEGIDYPYGYVRWTEQRNLASFLQLVAEGRVNVGALVTHIFGISDAPAAYQLLSGAAPPEASGKERPLAVVLEYPAADTGLEPVREPAQRQRSTVRRDSEARRRGSGRVRVGVIGAGSFARGVLLPAVRRLANIELRGVAAATGISAKSAQETFGFTYASTNTAEVIGDADTDAVLIATRHDLHARLAIDALEAGKAVFVEKPLGLTVEELRSVLTVQDRTGGILMVGFNRRFSPLVDEVRRCLTGRAGPLMLTYRVSAGRLSPDSWINDPKLGGGRIISEACHFVDLLHHLVGCWPTRVSATGFSSVGGLPPDNVSASLSFADGSAAGLIYSTSAASATGKERLEGFADHAAFVLDDFQSTRLVAGGRRWGRRSLFGAAQKGHREELRAFVGAVESAGLSPIDPLDAALASFVTFKILASVDAGQAVAIDPAELWIGGR